MRWELDSWCRKCSCCFFPRWPVGVEAAVREAAWWLVHAPNCVSSGGLPDTRGSFLAQVADTAIYTTSTMSPSVRLRTSRVTVSAEGERAEHLDQHRFPLSTFKRLLRSQSCWNCDWLMNAVRSTENFVNVSLIIYKQTSRDIFCLTHGC